MNARKLSNFLQSMERSCDLYSGSALAEREKLREVDTRYKQLDKSVHRTLNVVPRKSAPTTRPQTQKSRARTTVRNEEKETPQLVVRPAPYPVKNYILPATQLVGPQRYYRSRAKQSRRDEEISAIEEFDRFPQAFEHPPTKEEPSLVITATMTLQSSPVATNRTYC